MATQEKDIAVVDGERVDLETGEILEGGVPEGPVPGVYAKIAEVMGQVDRIPKTGRNEFHNYSYVEEAEIVERIRPLMAKAGLVCIPSQGERTAVEVETKSGSTFITCIRHTFRIVDTEDASEVRIYVWGEGQDTMDKGSYKAFTGAQKYCLLKLFQISTGDDPERDGSQGRQARRGGGGKATDKQVGYIRGLMKQKTLTDEEYRDLDDKLDGGISKDEASQAIERLTALPDRAADAPADYGADEEEPEPERKPATEEKASADQIATIRGHMDTAQVSDEEREKMEALIEGGISRGAAAAAISRLEVKIAEEEVGEDDGFFFTEEEKAVPKKDELRKDIVKIMGDLGWGWSRVHEYTDVACGHEYESENWKDQSWADVFMALPIADCQKIHAYIVQQAAKESEDE